MFSRQAKMLLSLGSFRRQITLYLLEVKQPLEKELAMVAKKKAPAKAKKQPATDGKALQTKYQTLLGLISYGIHHYFVTAGTTEKQKKLLEEERKKWGELA